MMSLKIPIKGYFLVLLITVALSCTSRESRSSQKEVHPNILWIIADDLSPDLGSYGNPLAYTPHTDKLASEGRVYTNAFATNPICSPSRSAIYTGMYQTTIGAHQHRTFNKSTLPDSIKVVTEYFEGAGYFTSNGNGKPNSKAGKTDFNFKADDIFDGPDWSQRKKGQPFFASVQIHYPHRPFDQDSLHPVDPDSVELPPYYPDRPLTRKDWSNYLESVQHMDQEVGRVLKRLDEEDLAANTIVFFFADQGRPQLRAKQWLYDAGLRVPLIIRWPGKISQSSSDKLVSLIDISAVSLKAAGIEIPKHLQGNNFIEGKGRDYIFASRNRADAVVDHIRAVRGQRYKYIRNYMSERPYTQFGHYKMYRYPTLALMHWLYEKDDLTPQQALFMKPEKPDEELYDTQMDPWELQNLANESEYQSKLREMRKQLNRWQKQTRDPGNYDPDDYDKLLERRRNKYLPRWESRGIQDPRDIDYKSYVEWWRQHLLESR